MVTSGSAQRDIIGGHTVVYGVEAPSRIEYFLVRSLGLFERGRLWRSDLRGKNFLGTFIGNHKQGAQHPGIDTADSRSARSSLMNFASGFLGLGKESKLRDRVFSVFRV